MPKNKIHVKINGAEYTLVGDESEDYLFSIANYVDKKVKEILHTNIKHSNTSSAVLTAVTITDELFKLKRQSDALKNSVQVPENKLKEAVEQYNSLNARYNSEAKEKEQLKNNYETALKDNQSLKESYDSLYEKYTKLNEDIDKLMKENIALEEQNNELKHESADLKENNTKLKGELLDKEIEFTKMSKDYRQLQNKRR